MGGVGMRRCLYFLLACLLLLPVSCKKTLESGGDEVQAVTVYHRSAVEPVTLSAGHETRTMLEDGTAIYWNAGDEIALFKSGISSNLQLLDAATVRGMTVGQKKSILLVNPSNSGCFLGYNGTSRVRNSDGLSALKGGPDITSEVAENNLKTITNLAQKFRSNTDYIFVLEKVSEGWLLYHKASGIGLTAGKGVKETDDRYPCVWGRDLAAFDIQDGKGNGGSTNTVTGRPEQIWVKNGDLFLWSGGNGDNHLCWHQATNGWTNWLFYEIPGSYPFTADSEGPSTTFTNNTGFDAGSDTWYTLYPSSAGISCENGRLVFSLPQMQTYREGSFGNGANVSVGVLNDGHISFRSVCGVLKLSLKGTQRVLSISVTDKAGLALWGTGSVSTETIGSGDCSATVSGGNATLTLDCGSGVVLREDTATDFYLVVPVGAFAQGFDVKIVSSIGTAVKSTSKANTIARADIKAMPAFSLADGTFAPTEVNIHNPVVEAYMKKGSYTTFGDLSHFNDSDVAALAEACSWSNDQPEGMTVSWTADGPVSITVTENEKTWFTEENVSGSSYTIGNLTPGSIYTYTVTRDGGTLAEGAFKAVGQVRMVTITDAWNYRDLGGWTGLQGQTIKYGKLFRGGSLNGQFIGTQGNHANAVFDNYVFHGQKEIDRLGIKAELDLRGDPKYIVGAWGSEENPHSVSLLETKLNEADFQRIMSDYGLYYPFKRSSIIQDVAWIIKELQAGKPVAFHCRSGADRTGAVSFLIEGLLGVSEGDLARDYELTSLSLETGKRLASDAAAPGYSYGFFKKDGGLFSISTGSTLQEKCYYYLNRQFDDVHINADDLDRFIREMLGLSSYSHPSWAKNHGENNTLDYVVSVNTGSGAYTYP